jgi:hypothetical protein
MWFASWADASPVRPEKKEKRAGPPRQGGVTPPRRHEDSDRRARCAMLKPQVLTKRLNFSLAHPGE